MRTATILLALIITVPAMGADDAQMLKLFGHLPNIKAKDVDKAAVDVKRMAFALEERSCSHPDYPDKEIAEMDPDVLSQLFDLPKDTCEGFIEAHRRMLEATGSGSWPAGCYPDHFPSNHALTYYVETDTFPSHYKRAVTEAEFQDIVAAGVWDVGTVAEARAKWDQGNMLETALALVDEAYRRIGCAHIRVHTGPNGEHNVHIKAKPIPGSTIGVAWFNDGSCGDHVNHHIDSTWRPGLHQLCNLLAHEFGHNHNLPHQFRGQDSHRGIMSYRPKYPFQGFRTGSMPGNLPRDPSLNQLDRQYGGEPVPVKVDTTDPPVDPPPSGPNSIAVALGDRWSLKIGGREVTVEVVGIDGDDNGPGTAARIAKAVDAVEGYGNKDRDRQALAAIYQATGQAVGDGSISFEEGQKALKTLRELLLGGEISKWSGVLAIADSVTSGDGMIAVAEGLTANEALPTELVSVIKLIVELLPDGHLKMIIKVILAVLGGLESEDDHDHPHKDQPVPLSAVPVRRFDFGEFAETVAG